MTKQTPQELDAAYLAATEFDVRDDIPRGEVDSFDFESAVVFPGSLRTIDLYVPAQYDGSHPACVYVALDGLTSFFPIPTAFDALIAAGDMPITIGIGVGSGVVSDTTGGNPRLQRSLEFDSMTGDLARLLLEEVFPAVESRTTAAGVPIRLSTAAADRAAGGLSTGGVGAFTLAWERPDAFSRVCSGIGTFVGMRGGDRYPVLVRKTEPKPIRVFLQEGENDGLPGMLDEVGDWWLGNGMMQLALVYAGYDVRHEFGKGMHSGRHMAAVFPDAMRWLWAGWPAAPETGATQNTFLERVLLPGEGWHRVTWPEPVDLAPEAQFAADGPRARYIVDPAEGELLIERAGETKVAARGLDSPSAVAVSPDGAWLAVASDRGQIGDSYRILYDGSVDSRQPFYTFHASESGEPSGARGWCFDRDGTLYAATAAGVQLFDRNGRVRPSSRAPTAPRSRRSPLLATIGLNSTSAPRKVPSSSAVLPLRAPLMNGRRSLTTRRRESSVPTESCLPSMSGFHAFISSLKVIRPPVVGPGECSLANQGVRCPRAMRPGARPPNPLPAVRTGAAAPRNAA